MIALFHSHGIGQFDYSSLCPDDLELIDGIAQEYNLLLCPTVYLRRDYLTQFVDVLHAFSAQKRKGALPNILGFSMEGPLLGPEGGVPRAGCWNPTVDEWRTIAALGSHGLRYIVAAPDAMGLDETIGPDFTFCDLLRECYGSGLRIALGHFRRDNPARSVDCIKAVLLYLHENYESSPYLVLTDHLFNDMPRAFTHAWRTKAEWEHRSFELMEFLATPWEPATLADTLGPVPAMLLQSARDGLLTPAINFDGAHVDLEICRRTVSYLGADRLIAMTDDTEQNTMAGEALHQVDGISLRYRDDGVVAAGSCGYQKQMTNMASAGISPAEVELMFGSLIVEALQYTPRARHQAD